MQDLAVQSIKGTEQASSFETLMRVAIEQARASSKGKQSAADPPRLTSA